MEAFADEGINEISAMCSAQSAKTLTILCLLAWAIAEDPGPILWVTSSIREARKLARTRLLPLLERCGPVAAKFPRNRHDRNTLEIFFPGAPLVITGAESTSSLQSTPFRYIFLDEVRNWPPGALEMVEKRTRSYKYNYKKVIISTPDEEQDAVHRAFLKGDQRHFFIYCPNESCKHPQELLWKDKDDKGGVKWDTNEQTKPEGSYNFDALAQTIRYECEECGHGIKDTPHERKQLSSSGLWKRFNTLAPMNSASFHWNALLPWWTSWKDQVIEFLNAKKALAWNDPEPLKSFVTETQGNPWSDFYRYQSDKKVLARRMGDYNPADFKPAQGVILENWRSPWEPEKRRFMTIDVQGKGGRHYWVLIRAWGLGGVSRLLYYDKIWNMEEVKQLANEWMVSPDNMIIDCANWTSEVFQHVIDSGYRWKPFRGDKKTHYRVHDRNFLHTVTDHDPALGTALQGRVRPIKQYLWAKYGALDRLHLFMNGLSGDWQIFKGASEEYQQQVTAWERRERAAPNGLTRQEWHCIREGNEHASACEEMQIIAASITEILGAPRDPLFAGQPA